VTATEASYVALIADRAPSQLARLTDRTMVATSVMLLATTAVLAALRPTLTAPDIAIVSMLATLCAAVGYVGWLRRAARAQRRGLALIPVRPAIEMALYLSPVILLTLAFPFATQRIADTHVGGAPLVSLLLASSVTVPWLSQPVCLPLYRAIGPLIPDGNIDVIQRRFLQVWPTTFLQSLPAVAVFAVPVQLVMGWSWQAFGAFLGLCVLHVAFVQSLIAANVDRRRLRWALAWACYATALIAIPAAWYLPPLVGLISQVVPMRRHLSQLRRTILLDKVDVAADLVRGLLLGAVLWADKLLLFLKSDGVFQVDAIFLALLPAVIAYNYYFIRLAPHIDRAVGDVRTAVEMEPTGLTARRSTVVSNVVGTSINRTAFLGALATLFVTVVAGARHPDVLGLVGVVSIASFLFMMTTLACYKLDYIGYKGQAQLFSAIHLLFCVGLFILLPVGVTLYVWLAAAEAVLFAVALYACLREWRTAEDALFWRHATAW
jgi:hypothetical protein